MFCPLPTAHCPLPTATMTVTVRLDPERPSVEAIKRAAAIIRGGGLVAFPTETVYGLGADATDEKAVRRVFEAKERPADNPLIVHVNSSEMLARVAERVSERAVQLIDSFWPGPLTLVLVRKPEVAQSVSAGLATVAVRMPQNRIALELIEQSDTPIAAPSANLSGRPSPTTAEHVAHDLGGRIEMILDGGPTIVGIESTVLDMTSDPPVILRPGWITEQSLAAVIGPVSCSITEKQLERSPGTRHRHYSPRARVVLIESGSPDFIQSFCAGQLKGGRVAFLGHTPLGIDSTDFEAIILENSARAYARSIYAALRELDEKSPRVIVVEAIGERGEGAAVMDRLRRAAVQRIRE
jgi:L-threonylcarbamoyladenylate synthase